MATLDRWSDDARSAVRQMQWSRNLVVSNALSALLKDLNVMLLFVMLQLLLIYMCVFQYMFVVVVCWL